MSKSIVIQFFKANPNKEVTTTQISDNLGVTFSSVATALRTMRTHHQLFPKLKSEYKYITIIEYRNKMKIQKQRKCFVYKWCEIKEKETNNENSKSKNKSL